MSTTTGATNDQVEDAVEREWKRATERGIARGDASFEAYFFRQLPRMLQHAADLVTADECIVRRDDLQLMLLVIFIGIDQDKILPDERDALARLRAAIGPAAQGAGDDTP